MSPSLQTMGFFMSDINFCNTKEQLNHLGEVVTGKVDGSPTGADIEESTLPYTGQVRKTLPALEDKYEQSITDKEAEADAAIDEYRQTNKGDYAAGITLENKFEFITYNGESYFATNPPYTTTATTPDADGNLFVGGYLNQAQAGSMIAARSGLTFPTLTDLKSGTLLNGSSVTYSELPEYTKLCWEGYFLRSDGGSNWGHLRFGPHTEDGGSIISIDSVTYVQANHGGGKTNIKKFGAKGDGVDDTQSILNAASFSKNLKIPTGDFVLSGSALEYMTANDISITGYGDGSLLRRLDAGNVIYIDGCNKVNVSKVQVNGLFSYVSGSGAINLTNCTSFNISNNYVSSSSRQGIKAENCQYGTIRGNRVTGCYQDGIMVRTESRRVTIVGNVCWNNGDPAFAPPIGEGIHLFAVQDCVVNANICYANNDNGIALEGADNCVITGNSCSANVVTGISLNKEDGSSRFNGGTIVSGNTCQDNGTDGIGISACRDMIVSGNTCTENTGYGISQGLDPAVTQYRVHTLNNIIRGNSAGGIIHNWNNEDCQIKGNTLRGPVGNGILINRPQSVDTIITGNNIKGFAGSQLQDNGTNSVVKENQGFVTENKGSVSFSDVSTAELVNHGLDYTPDISDISAFISSASTTNPIGNIRIYSPNATQFIIGFDNAAGAGGVDISWSVRRI